MGDAREHQEQRTAGILGGRERPADAELVGELFQGELHTEDGAALGLAGDPIELARRSASTRSTGQWVRFARVRFLTLPSTRKPSRRRTAGGELWFGTVWIYMPIVIETDRPRVKLNRVPWESPGSASGRLKSTCFINYVILIICLMFTAPRSPITCTRHANKSATARQNTARER